MAIVTLDRIGTTTTLSLVLGRLAFGRDFFEMLWAFLTEDVPDWWERRVQPNRYYRASKRMLQIAIALPGVGSILALIFSTAELHPKFAQSMIYLTFFPSFLIFGLLLLLAGTFAAITVYLYPSTTETKEDIRIIKRGQMKVLARALAWELTVGIFWIILGVYATIEVLALFIMATLLFFVAAYGFNRPVKYAADVMLTTGLGLMIVLALILSVTVVSPRYVAAAGLRPSTFAHGGVVDTSIDTTKRVYLETKRAVCQKEMKNIQDAIKEAAVDAEPFAKLKTQLQRLETIGRQCL